MPRTSSEHLTYPQFKPSSGLYESLLKGVSQHTLIQASRLWFVFER